jgi:hypothetical protein
MVARLNTASGSNDASGTALNSSAFNVTAQALIVVGCAWEAPGATTPTVTDSAGNTYTVLTPRGVSGYKYAVLAFAVANGDYTGNVVTFTLSAAREYRQVLVAQYSGLMASDVLDTETGNTASSATTVSTPTFDTVGAGLVVAMTGLYNNRTFVKDGDYDLVHNITYATLQERIATGALDDDVVTSSNTGDPTYYALCVAAFKALAGTPSAPTDVAVDSVTASSARVTWADASANETGFKVQYRNITDSGSWTSAPGSPTAADEESLVVGDLLPSTEYEFRVAATNGDGDSSWVTSSPVTTGAILEVSFVDEAHGTTTATLPAHQARDLLLAFAFRAGSATPPALPAGWHNIAAAGSAGGSFRLAWRVAEGDGTAVGTWTNASGVLVHVYRPPEGRMAIPGRCAAQVATAGQVSYAALAPFGTSLVAAFAGHTATDTALESPPDGFSLRGNHVAGACEVAGFDSGATLSGVEADSVTVGGSSGTWATALVEVRELPAPSLFYAIYPAALDAPALAQLVTRNTSQDTAATAAGDEQSRGSTGQQVFASPAAGLTPETQYRVALAWFDGVDASNVAVSGPFATLSVVDGVTIAPEAASVRATQSLQFVGEAYGLGSPDPSVTWSVEVGDGTITGGGLYTAPAEIDEPVETVRATSVADPTKYAEALVTLLPAVDADRLHPSAIRIAGWIGDQLAARVRLQLAEGDPSGVTVTALSSDPTRVTVTASAVTDGNGAAEFQVSCIAGGRAVLSFDDAANDLHAELLCVSRTNA